MNLLSSVCSAYLSMRHFDDVCAAIKVVWKEFFTLNTTFLNIPARLISKALDSSTRSVCDKSMFSFSPFLLLSHRGSPDRDGGVSKRKYSYISTISCSVCVCVCVLLEEIETGDHEVHYLFSLFTWQEPPEVDSVLSSAWVLQTSSSRVVLCVELRSVIDDAGHFSTH